MIPKKLNNLKKFWFMALAVILCAAWLNSTVFFRSLLSDYYFKLGKADKAIAIQNKIIRRGRFLEKNRSVSFSLLNLGTGKSLFDAHYKLSEIYKKLDKWYEVCLEFATLMKLSAHFAIDPKSAPETCALSLAYYYNNDYAKAISLLNRLEVLSKSDFPVCDTVFIGGIRKDMLDSFSHFGRGRLLALKGDYADALWEYTFALLSCGKDMLPDIERDLNRLPRESPWNADTFYKLGLGYKRLGERKKAISAFQDAVSVAGMHLPSYFQLKELYKMEDNQSDAERIDSKVKEEYSRMQTVKVSFGNQQDLTLPIVKLIEAENYFNKEGLLINAHGLVFNNNILKINDQQASGGAAISDRNRSERSLLFWRENSNLPAGMYTVYFRAKLIEGVDKEAPVGIIDVIFKKFYKTSYTQKRFHQAHKIIYASDFKRPGQYQDFRLDFFSPGSPGELDFRFFNEKAGEKVYLDRVVLAYLPDSIDEFHTEITRAYVDLYTMALGPQKEVSLKQP